MAAHLPAAVVNQLKLSDPGELLQTAIGLWVRQQLAEAGAESQTDLYRRFLTSAESALFSEILDHTQQNRSAAAKLLGVDRATLRSKLGPS